jgi:hypothetical protein
MKKNEDKQQAAMDIEIRLPPQIWARLASIPTVEELREGERMMLVEDLWNLLQPWLEAVGHNAEDFNALPSDTLTRRFSDHMERALSILHRYAREIIGELVDGKVVVNPPYAELSLTWRIKNGVLYEQVVKERWRNRPLFLPVLIEYCVSDLVQLLRRKPFPFKRCPICQAVFVPVRKQKYCSPNCTYKGVETARKDTKREYMKNYMANRRKKAKTRQRRKEV